MNLVPDAVLHILLVDDDMLDRAAVTRALAQSGMAVDVAEADSVRAACAWLAERAFDVVICDHFLRDGDSLEVLAQRGPRNAYTPFVALTGQGDDVLAAELMRRGATDYLPKAQVTAPRLRKCVHDALRVRDVEARGRSVLAAAIEAAGARDAMMSVVSHDLRGPLGTVTMGAALLREAMVARGADGTREMQTLARMERACKRMQELINDLQDVARVDAGTFRIEPRLVRVGDVLREAADAVQLQADAVGVEVRVTLGDDEVALQLDRQRIQQALGNLVGNALKVTPRSGVITLGAEVIGPYVKLAVGDSGAGLEPEEVPHVFDRHWQGRKGTRGSSGMGLFIARTIAEAHGGRAEVQSEVGRGSTFSLLIPRDR